MVDTRDTGSWRKQCLSKWDYWTQDWKKLWIKIWVIHQIKARNWAICPISRKHVTKGKHWQHKENVNSGSLAILSKLQEFRLHSFVQFNSLHWLRAPELHPSDEVPSCEPSTEATITRIKNAKYLWTFIAILSSNESPHGVGGNLSLGRGIMTIMTSIAVTASSNTWMMLTLCQMLLHTRNTYHKQQCYDIHTKSPFYGWENNHRKDM